MQTIHAQKVQDARRALFPADAVMHLQEDTNAVVFVYQRRDSFCAAGFSGRKTKPDFHYRYQTPERRDRQCADWLAEQRARHERQMRADGVAHPFVQGDILFSTYGYEQTNVDFYKVLATTPATLVLRQLASVQTPQDDKHFTDRGTCVAIPDQFARDSQEFRVRVCKHAYGDDVTFTVNVNRGLAQKWDGTPRRYTSYA